MSHPTRWVALAVLGATVGLAIVFAVQFDNEPGLESGKLLGEPAPAFAGVDLVGAAVDSTELAGKAVLVNFWNEWCLPCQEETAALVAFYGAHGDDADFEMVGIVRDMRSERALRDYVLDQGIGWTVMFDPQATAAVDYSTTGQPESFMIAADGTVVGFQAGALDVGDLELMLTAARGEVAS